MMKFSFSLVFRLVMFPVTLGLMLIGDPMLERITGLLMLATLDSVTVGRPVRVVIALMLIWKGTDCKRVVSCHDLTLTRSEVFKGSMLMSSSPSSASWSNRSSAPTIALKKVTLRVTTKILGQNKTKQKKNVEKKLKNPSIRNTKQTKQEQAELKDLYVETILKN